MPLLLHACCCFLNCFAILRLQFLSDYTILKTSKHFFSLWWSCTLFDEILLTHAPIPTHAPTHPPTHTHTHTHTHWNLNKNLMALFYGWCSAPSMLQSQGEEAVYFLPLSSQKFLVLIWSTSGGLKAESTLQPLSSFEHGTPGLGLQRLNH